METASRLPVETIYINPPRQSILNLYLSAGTTIREAIIQSGMLEQYDEIDLEVNKVGVYGELKDLDTLVEAGDRIEIYRPLKADPKEARRQRAKKK